MKKLNAKSVMIGFLLCMVLLFSFGFQTVKTNNTEYGKYQAWSSVDGVNFMINTSTGELYKTGIFGSFQIQKYSWKSISKEEIIKE